MAYCGVSNRFLVTSYSFRSYAGSLNSVCLWEDALNGLMYRTDVPSSQHWECVLAHSQDNLYRKVIELFVAIAAPT